MTTLKPNSSEVPRTNPDPKSDSELESTILATDSTWTSLHQLFTSPSRHAQFLSLRNTMTPLILELSQIPQYQDLTTDLTDNWTALQVQYQRMGQASLEFQQRLVDCCGCWRGSVRKCFRRGWRGGRSKTIRQILIGRRNWRARYRG